MIIVLNGPSSAGKTTLARSARDALGPTAAAVSIDQFFAFLHRDAKVGWTMFAALTEAVFSSAVALAREDVDVIVDPCSRDRSLLVRPSTRCAGMSIISSR